MSQGLPEVFARVADFALSRGALSIKDLPGCWEAEIDARWWVAVNGHGETKACSRGIAVPRYSMYFEFNGWPAGVVNAGGGSIVAHGEAANEDALLAALAEATRAALDEAEEKR